MSHTLSHENGETLDPADIDRSFELLRQSINMSPVVTAKQLDGQLGIDSMSNELKGFMNYLGSAIASQSDFTLNHYDTIQILPMSNNVFVYGYSKASDGLEIADYVAIDMSMGATGSVTGVVPQDPPMTIIGDEIWAVGYQDPASGLMYSNRISRFSTNGMVSNGYFEVDSNPFANVAAIIGTGSHVYAYVQDGSYVDHIIKIQADPIEVVGTMNSGIVATGDISMAISTNNYIYVAYESQYQVRKYSSIPATGWLKTYTLTDMPTKILSAGTNMMVLAGSNLYEIDDVHDTISSAMPLGFTGTAMDYDGLNLWIASGDTLYKCDTDGNTLQTFVPYSSQNIKDVKSTLGFIWITYEGNVSVNASRIFVGLPGI